MSLFRNKTINKEISTFLLNSSFNDITLNRTRDQAHSNPLAEFIYRIYIFTNCVIPLLFYITEHCFFDVWCEYAVVPMFRSIAGQRWYSWPVSGRSNWRHSDRAARCRLLRRHVPHFTQEETAARCHSPLSVTHSQPQLYSVLTRSSNSERQRLRKQTRIGMASLPSPPSSLPFLTPFLFPVFLSLPFPFLSPSLPWTPRLPLEVRSLRSKCS